jgi:hypothetical protein
MEQGSFAIDAYAGNTADVVEVARDGVRRVYPNKAPGTTLLGLPVFRFWWTVLRPLGLAAHVHWHAVAYLTTVCTVGLLSALAAAAMLGVLERACGDRLAALLAVAAVWLGSIAFPYSTLFFSHQLAAALLALAFVLLFRLRHEAWPARRAAGHAAAAGFLISFSVATEYPAAILAGLLALYATWVLARGAAPRPERLRAGLLFGAGLAAGAALLAAYNLLAFGRLWYTPYQEYSSQGPELFQAVGRGVGGVMWRGLGPFLEVLAEITVRPQRGLLYLGLEGAWIYACSPVLWLALPGLYLLARRPGLRAEAALCGAALLAYLAFNACYGDSIVFWGGATSVGPRHLVPALPFAALPLSLAARRLKAALVPLLLLSTASMLMATAVEPRTPYEPRNPWRELYVPSYLAGSFAVARDGLFHPDRMLTSDSTAFNLGKLAGLPGRWQLAPLLLGWAALGALLVRGAAPPARAAGAGVLGAYAGMLALAPALLGPSPRALSPRSGLTARLYGNAHWEGEPLEMRVDRTLVFDWSGGTPLQPPWSVEWRGFLLADQTGRYRFALESDDGSRLWIDGLTIVDNGGVHGEQRQSGDVHLARGRHAIRVRYFDAGHGAVFRLLWTPPGRSEAALPPEVLLQEEPTSNVESSSQKGISLAHPAIAGRRDFFGAPVTFAALGTPSS